MIPRFRAYDKKNKRMCEVITLKLSDDACVEVRYEEDGEMKQAWLGNGEFELMMGLNVKDKNRMEIFESDIVQWADEIAVVVEDYADFKLELQNRSKDLERLPDHRSIKILGNIHENPDLLK